MPVASHWRLKRWRRYCLGADPVGPEAVLDRLHAHLQGHVYAKSAIDIALWDLTGKAAGLPLYRLLGGHLNNDLPLYHSITCVAPDEMARMAIEAKSRGMGQFQVKLGADADWEADVARLRQVREAVGQGPLVYGDWDCGVTRLHATRVGRAVSDVDVMLEQPGRRLDDCAAVRQATGLPMKIDECAHDTASLLEAHALGCMDAVAIKLSKFGGLSASRSISTRARRYAKTAAYPRPAAPVSASPPIRTCWANPSSFWSERTPMDAAISQADWIARAASVLPAGGFGNFEPDIIIREGRSSRVWDEDGNEYIDYLIGSGPMLLGHGHPEVLDAVAEQLPKGMTFFANNARGVELAEEIISAVASAEQVRYVSTGGEADMYAIRLARAHTGRDRILKFEGGYHGMSAEALMSLAPQRLENFPLAVPDSAGIPQSVREHMLIAPFNDIEFARSIITEHGDEIAGIIVEPLQRLIPPAPGFLEALREEATKHGIVLIFDEVVTGFRLAYGGAQELYSVVPDLCTLGKVIGGGFPLAAIAGKADIMQHFDKAKVGEAGFTFQMGTLSGNPVASVAGLKTMEILRRPGSYERLRGNGQTVMAALSEHLGATGIAHEIVGDPVLFDVVFTPETIRDYRGVLRADAELGVRFNRLLRESGIFKPDGKTYPSLALTDADLDQTVEAIRSAAGALMDA